MGGFARFLGVEKFPMPRFALRKRILMGRGIKGSGYWNLRIIFSAIRGVAMVWGRLFFAPGKPESSILRYQGPRLLNIGEKWKCFNPDYCGYASGACWGIMGSREGGWHSWRIGFVEEQSTRLLNRELRAFRVFPGPSGVFR